MSKTPDGRTKGIALVLGLLASSFLNTACAHVEQAAAPQRAPIPPMAAPASAAPAPAAPAVVMPTVAMPTIAMEVSSAVSSQPFYFGADLSYVNEMDDCGAVYRDGGQRVDAYELFAKRGTNLVRLRVWNNPDWTKYSTGADIARSAARAKAAGMPVLLDFHYSDNWADPGDQIIPKAWEKLSDQELAKAVHAFTRDKLLDLHKQGLLPQMVQVGNETNTEVMVPAAIPEDSSINWTRNALLLNAGIAGVREAQAIAGKPIEIMLHIAQPEYAEPWFDAARSAGVRDYDLIGLSYYAKWSKKDFAGLATTMRRLRHRFDKPVIVVETAYPFTLEGKDQAGNILGEDSLVKGYPATLDGQKRYYIDLTQTVFDAGGAGIVPWEPAWVSNNCRTRWGLGSHWENTTFFDLENTKAHSGFDFLRHPYRRLDTRQVRISGLSGQQVFVRSSAFGGEDFTVPLAVVDGQAQLTLSAPKGQSVQLALFADAAATKPIALPGTGRIIFATPPARPN